MFRKISLFIVFLASFNCFGVEIIARHIVSGGGDSYAAFPSLYKIKNGDGLGFSVVAREYASHHKATGKNIYMQSFDCGMTWRNVDELPPSDIFSDNKPGYYSRVVANGWVEISKPNDIFKDKLVRHEINRDFVALGGIERKTQDFGKTWTSTQMPVPDHAVLMNYNDASNIKTEDGTRITALYYKEKKGYRNRVLFAVKKAGYLNWNFFPLPMSLLQNEVGFDETALVELNNGNVVALMRPDPDAIGYLYYSVSKDKGETWSLPKKTNIYGYPASVIAYKDNLLVTVGVRKIRPFSIDSYIVDKNDLTILKKVKIDFSSGEIESDFGYPITLLCGDHLVTTYYTPGEGRSVNSVILVWKY